MTDVTKPGPSIQSLIDKGLNARLKKLNLVPAKKVSTRSYPHSAFLANDCSNYSELVWPRKKGSEIQVQPILLEGSPSGESKVYGNVKEKERRTDCQEEDGQGKAESRDKRSKGKRQSIVTESSVSIPLPSTLPYEILNYTWDHAVIIPNNLMSESSISLTAHKNIHWRPLYRVYY